METLLSLYEMHLVILLFHISTVPGKGVVPHCECVIVDSRGAQDISLRAGGNSQWIENTLN